MFRRPFGVIGRPILRRPRLMGAALLGGAGYALGRRNRPPASETPDATGRRLAALEDLHAAGALTDEEFEAARARLEAAGQGPAG
jgi:hypothetical protein